MKENSIKNNFIYNSIYQIVAIIVPLITTPYLSRILLPEGIGTYSYAYTIASYFITIAMLGLNNYGNRTIAAVRDDKKILSKNFSEIYCMQILFCLLSLLLYLLYTFVISNDFMQLVLIPIVVSGLFDINWFFYGIEKFKLITMRNIAIKIINTIIVFIFIKEKTDIYIYGFVMSATVLVSQLSLWPVLKNEIIFSLPNWKSVRRHIRPNLLLFLPVIAISVYKMLDKIMLGFMAGKIEVGYFESVEKLIQVPLAFIVALGTVMLPKISNLVANNNIDKTIRYLKISMIFVVFVTSTTCFGIMSISREFVPFFYGKGFEPCVKLFYVLMPSCFFLAIANVIRTQILIPQKMDSIYIKSVVIGGAVNIMFNILMIPKYGALGAAYGTLFAEATVCIYQVRVVSTQWPVIESLIVSLPMMMVGIVIFVINYSLNFDSGFYSLGIKILLAFILTLLISGVIYMIYGNRIRKYIQ